MNNRIQREANIIFTRCAFNTFLVVINWPIPPTFLDSVLNSAHFSKKYPLMSVQSHLRLFIGEILPAVDSGSFIYDFLNNKRDHYKQARKFNKDCLIQVFIYQLQIL
jgi:hypothetical protein